MPRESGLQKRGPEGIRNPFRGLAVGPRRSLLTTVTKGKRKRRLAEVERATDLAGETKHFLSGVPDIFIKYEVACPPRVRRKRVEVAQ